MLSRLCKNQNAQRFHAPYISQETVTSAYHFLGGGAAGEGFGGELILHGGQVPVQQIQGGMHPSRIAVIPCLFYRTQLLSQLPDDTQRQVLQQGVCVMGVCQYYLSWCFCKCLAKDSATQWCSCIAVNEMHASPKGVVIGFKVGADARKC